MAQKSDKVANKLCNEQLLLNADKQDDQVKKNLIEFLKSQLSNYNGTHSYACIMNLMWQGPGGKAKLFYGKFCSSSDALIFILSKASSQAFFHTFTLTVNSSSVQEKGGRRKCHYVSLNSFAPGRFGFSCHTVFGSMLGWFWCFLIVPSVWLTQMFLCVTAFQKTPSVGSLGGNSGI